MADIRYYDVILKPIVTEKSMNAMGEKKYTFMVHPEANKSQIKEAVETNDIEGCDLAGFNSNRFDIPVLAEELQTQTHPWSRKEYRNRCYTSRWPA